MAYKRCDDDVGRCHYILMLFLAYTVEPTGYFVHSKCINAEMMLFTSKLEQAVHTECIFCAFS